MSNLLKPFIDLQTKVGQLDTSETPTYSSGSWPATFGGFSANPTGGVFLWVKVGKSCRADVYLPNTGTSNATTFTISAPFTAATISGMVWRAHGGFVTNVTANSSPGAIEIVSAGNVFNLYTDLQNSAWNNSGAKGMRGFSIHYMTI